MKHLNQVCIQRFSNHDNQHISSDIHCSNKCSPQQMFQYTQFIESDLLWSVIVSVLGQRRRRCPNTDTMMVDHLLVLSDISKLHLVAKGLHVVFHELYAATVPKSVGDHLRAPFHSVHGNAAPGDTILFCNSEKGYFSH